jgi:hypothetical protein
MRVATASVVWRASVVDFVRVGMEGEVGEEGAEGRVSGKKAERAALLRRSLSAEKRPVQ